MNRTLFFPALVVLGFAAIASAQTAGQPNKVGIIDMQGALGSTQEGQKLFGELATRYDPRRKALEKRQSEITALQDQRSAVRDYRAALALGGTRTLPGLFRAAGTSFAFDRKTIGELMRLVEEQLAVLAS